MKRLVVARALSAILLVPLGVNAQDISISGTPCPATPPASWTDLVDRTDSLLDETRLVFTQGALALSPSNAETNRSLALRWIDMNEEWRKIDIPEGRGSHRPAVAHRRRADRHARRGAAAPPGRTTRPYPRRRRWRLHRLRPGLPRFHPKPAHTDGSALALMLLVPV